MHVESEDDVLADNYTELAIRAWEQVLQDIHCYYCHTGTPEDRHAGKYAITWVRKMKGSFRVLATAMDTTTIEELHQGLLAHINRIKYEGRRLQATHQTGKARRIPDMHMV